MVQRVNKGDPRRDAAGVPRVQSMSHGGRARCSWSRPAAPSEAVVEGLAVASDTVMPLGEPCLAAASQPEPSRRSQKKE